MRGDRVCPKCGQTIPPGTAECPICARPLSFHLRRETLLLVYFAILVLLFTITGFTVTWYHGKEQSLGQGWYARGEEALQKGNAPVAMADFRNALYHAPGNPRYQLRLAQALIQSGHFVEARTYLVRLWASDPASGPVNLALARLTMHQKGPASEVIIYFHSAIDGEWSGQAEDHRRAMRKEFCEYLIDNGRQAEATAEIAALAAETPNDPKLLTQAGLLFLKVQDYSLALKEFQQALSLNSHQPDAWAGAGTAAFALAQYRTARSDLSRAVAENPANSDAARTLGLARYVLEIDPFDLRIPVRERQRRAIRAFQFALARLNQCAQSRGEPLNVLIPQTPLEKVSVDALKLKPEMQPKTLQQNPDLLDSAMSVVFRIEEITKNECGSPSGLDQALLLLASKSRTAD